MIQVRRVFGPRVSAAQPYNVLTLQLDRRWLLHRSEFWGRTCDGTGAQEPGKSDILKRMFEASCKS
jgi:hypothetical protein